MDSSGDDVSVVIQSLFKDLELGDIQEARLGRDLKQEFGDLLQLSEEVLKKLGLDAAVVMGLSGDWEIANEICRQLVVRCADDRMAIKLWQLRALFELEKYPEALALSTSTRWPSELLIHVNYLTGEAFEGLRMYDEARLRFDAVFKLNRSYRNIAQKITRY